MKRYRIFSFDFDSRAHSLEPVQDQWDEKVKELHIQNREKTIKGLAEQFGNWSIEQKVKNFQDLKLKPFSVAAFHNKFLEQIRNSFVVGGYYPALTGSCALGERILNHMVLLLRDYHKESPEYKKLYRKQSFDYWPVAIDALESWGELLPEAAEKLRDLNDKRNHAIHFNPETDHNDRELALQAIHLVQDIVSAQFSAFGRQPWYFCVPGEMYIKKEWEDRPLIKHIFIPNSALVGPKHRVESMIPKIVVNDRFEYEDREISDEEYIELRQRR
ncbi:hypothetical protein LCGC14_0209770 [marine sediment metagenome]|uniref:DUF4145 domain-containing protein n=1 Tax=marine sediment metagenome TaxID=412755 RepID=A0A0F9UKH5_9ZZZZ|nr:hypothetical protein [Halomonas sp.]HDZ48221.1 hypothetical protein [Halomonas sp.]